MTHPYNITSDGIPTPDTIMRSIQADNPMFHPIVVLKLKAFVREQEQAGGAGSSSISDFAEPSTANEAALAAPRTTPKTAFEIRRQEFDRQEARALERSWFKVKRELMTRDEQRTVRRARFEEKRRSMMEEEAVFARIRRYYPTHDLASMSDRGILMYARSYLRILRLSSWSREEAEAREYILLPEDYDSGNPPSPVFQLLVPLRLDVC
jgi:hypothetical protein